MAEDRELVGANSRLALAAIAVGLVASVPGIAVLKLVAEDPAITAKIASVLIRGQALGTPGGSDGFGFVAQQIGSLRIGGTTSPLRSGASNDTTPLPVGATADLFAREV